MTRVVALIPVRGSSSAKTRLSSLFREEERLALAWSMLRRLTDEIDASGMVDHTVVITRDPGAVEARIGRDDAMTILPQAGDGDLNAALQQGRQWAQEQGYDVVLVLPGDLPLVTAGDIRAMIEAPGPLVVATDRAEDGTNALRIDLSQWSGEAFRFCMGPGSAGHHIARARETGNRVTTLFRPGIAHDLDTPRDWADLPSHRQDALLQDIHDSLSAAGNVT